MKWYVFTIVFLIFSLKTVAQEAVKSDPKSILQAGPMLGFCEYREAVIWLQTKKEADVYIEYFDKKMPETLLFSDHFTTKKHDANTARIILNEVLPGREYQYQVMVDGKKLEFPYPTTFKTQEDWKFRIPPPDFTVAFGSCNYINEPSTDRPGNPYGGDYRIFTSIVQKKPDLMLWGGDNTYLRPSDWGTRTGIIHRYTHTRSCEEIQPLLAACPNLAIWDDHDFGPNDSNGSFILQSTSHEVFRMFWANPPFVTFPQGQSLTSHFEMNGVDFFLLDNRSFRTPYYEMKIARQMLGIQQIEWLIQNLKFSQSPFKMVMCGSQMLSDAEIFENFAQFPTERNYLLRRLEEENIKGVVFLTGDRHHSEISKYTSENGNVFFDITSSPLTSSAGERSRENEPNQLRVPGTFHQQRNFVLLSFTGSNKERTLTATYYDTDGKSLGEYVISQADFSTTK